VAVGVEVSVAMGDVVLVGVADGPGDGVAVEVDVDVRVGEGVCVGTSVGTSVGTAVGNSVGTSVGVGVSSTGEGVAVLITVSMNSQPADRINRMSMGIRKSTANGNGLQFLSIVTSGTAVHAWSVCGAAPLSVFQGNLYCNSPIVPSKCIRLVTTTLENPLTLLRGLVILGAWYQARSLYVLSRAP